jgi:nitrite reductase (NADH) small subunit
MVDNPVLVQEPIAAVWHRVCAVSRVGIDRGVGVLIDEVPIAVFRLHDGSLHALSGTDPFSQATVMSRGIVGSIGGRAVVASPMFKQRFDLLTGVCLDDPTVSVCVYAVREHEAAIEISLT